MGKRGGIQLFDDKREEFFSICDLASQRNFLEDNFLYQYQPGGLFASVGQVGMNFGVSPNSSNSSDNNNGSIKSSYNDLYVKYVPLQDSARIVEVLEGEKTLKKKKGGLKLKIKIANPSLRRLFSGAIAGAVSRTAVAPLETVRTHLMVGSSGHSTTELFHNIMKTDGWKGLFWGNLVNVIRVAPSKAIEHRGGRSHRRGFSDRPHNGGRGPFVSGDSHLRSIQDSNLGFRQGTFSNQTVFQPPPYNQNQQFTQPLPHNQNQQFRPPPSYNQTQRFWQPSPPFDQNRAVRPRTSKPLYYRNWEYTKEAPPPNSERFVFHSYNILADYLAINPPSKLYFRKHVHL